MDSRMRILHAVVPGRGSLVEPLETPNAARRLILVTSTFRFDPSSDWKRFSVCACAFYTCTKKIMCVCASWPASACSQIQLAKFEAHVLIRLFLQKNECRWAVCTGSTSSVLSRALNLTVEISTVNWAGLSMLVKAQCQQYLYRNFQRHQKVG